MTRESKISIEDIGKILEVIGVPILIIVAVLMNMPNKDLGAISVLFVIGVCSFFVGFMLSHLPPQNEKEEQSASVRRL